MCLDRTALNALAAVTAGAIYRRRSPAPRPLRVGKPIERERMFAPSAFDLLAAYALARKDSDAS